MNYSLLFYPIFDKLLELMCNSLGLNALSSIAYLLLIFIVMFTSSLVSLVFIGSKCKHNVASDYGIKCSYKRKIVYIALYLTIAIGMISSYRAYHYSIILIIGLGASFIALASIGCEPMLTLMLVILAIFGANYRLLSSGIEEGETTSDMINMWLNGFFRWSIHGGHYDLAPLDAIGKVVAAQIVGSNVYDPILGTLQYVLHGVAALLLAYSLAKKLSANNSSILALIALATMSYPYSPLLGLTAPPAPLSQAMGLMACTLILPQILLGERGVESVIASIPLLAYAVLAHPSSLGLVLVLLATVMAVKVSRNTTPFATKPLWCILAIALLLYFAKVLYTTFTSGFVSYLQLLVTYILNAFREERPTFTTRNIAYSSLPRPSITAFAVFPAIVGAYSVLLLLRVIKSLSKRVLNFIDAWFILVAALYAAFSVVAVLSGIGGVSQSRIVFNGVQPYIELALVLHVAYTVRQRQGSAVAFPRALSHLLLLAALSTLITPNAMPLNYSIPMAKPATLNDHVIAYTYMGLVDRDLFINIYNSYGESGRLVALQERGDVAYGLGSTMAVVYYYIAPRVVDAKSYWDPRIMSAFAMPRGGGYIIHRIFDAWVYSFYLYVR